VAARLKQILWVASAVAVGVLAAGSPVSARTTAVNGLIAVESDLLGTPQIWLIHPNGSAAHWFTDGAQPSWSSDGTRLVYLTPDRSMIEIAGLNGEHDPLAIANPPAGMASPALSPDGASVAFAGGDGLYVVGSDGGEATRLATAYDPGPAWSPNGAWIAFVDHGSAVALVHPDGSGFHELNDTHANVGSRVAWSPDGTEIAYTDSTSGGLDAAHLDDSPPTQLVPYLGDNTLSDPAWSPDGTRIAFFDNVDVCLANTDGTDIDRLTYTPVTPFARSGVTGHPAWQPLPDGSASVGSSRPGAGPGRTWNRNHSWYPACGLVWRGLYVTAAGPPRVAAGNRASVVLTVTNRSQSALGTSGLVGVAAQLTGGVFISARTGQGLCDAPRGARHFDCDLGALWPHERAQVKLQVRAGGPGKLVLTCYLPRPATTASEPSHPDCMQRIQIRAA
jgi:Tol biopolymer transport system component